MTKRQMLFTMTAFNLLWLFALVIILSVTRSAQAQTPTVIVAGPFYETYSGADFVPYSAVDFPIKRDGYAVIRDAGYGVGVAGIHLPPNAVITSLTNDSEVVGDGSTNPPVDVLLLECALGSATCNERARATRNTLGRAQTTTTLGSPVSLDTANRAYFLQLNLDGLNSSFYSKFYYARIGYTVPYSFTINSLFLPNVNR